MSIESKEQENGNVRTGQEILNDFIRGLTTEEILILKNHLAEKYDRILGNEKD